MHYLSIHTFAMPYRERKYEELFIFYAADDSVVADAVAPQSVHLSPQRFAATSRIVECRYLILQIS